MQILAPYGGIRHTPFSNICFKGAQHLNYLNTHPICLRKTAIFQMFSYLTDIYEKTGEKCLKNRFLSLKNSHNRFRFIRQPFFDHLEISSLIYQILIFFRWYISDIDISNIISNIDNWYCFFHKVTTLLCVLR